MIKQLLAVSIMITVPFVLIVITSWVMRKFDRNDLDTGD